MAGYLGTKAVLLSTTAASVGGDATIGGDLTVDTNTLYVDSANNRVGIGNTSPTQALDVTGDIITSGGVYLGGTGSANHLDDYEEGTWTPTWSNMFTQGCFDTATGFSVATGKYTKIGQLVWCYAEVQVSGASTAIAATANYSINYSSLPFTPASHGDAFYTLHGTVQAYGAVGVGAIQSGVITPLEGQTVLVVTYTGSPTGVGGSVSQSLGFCYRTTA